MGQLAYMRLFSAMQFFNELRAARGRRKGVLQHLGG